MTQFFRRISMAALLMLLSSLAFSATKIPVKVVVVTMFEYGEVTGDKAGEFQLWTEREKLNHVYPFPLGNYDLRMNDDGLLVICTGGGISNATSSIMALGLDPRFDLSKAYWLIAGIAGGDPLDVSLGSAVWSSEVVDGDLLYEIDAREIPEDWPYGLIPLGAKKPNDTVNGWTVDTIAYSLNAQLSRWAFEQTKDYPLADSLGIKKFRQQFKGYKNAQRPPFVTMGANLSSSTYWHGKQMNTWANDWVAFQAKKDVNFMVANMEDSGSITALYRLARIGLVDTNRLMVLRTVSNYTMPPLGKTAAWSTTAPYADEGLPALEAAYQIGSTVVKTIVKNWSTFKKTIPSVK